MHVIKVSSMKCMTHNVKHGGPRCEEWGQPPLTFQNLKNILLILYIFYIFSAPPSFLKFLKLFFYGRNFFWFTVLKRVIYLSMA